MDDETTGEQPQNTAEQQPDETAKDQHSELGQYLRDARMALGLSLRDVEEATGHEVSNAYLSQLETAKVKKPSPHVLYALSLALSVPYDELMQRAGYIVPQDQRTDVAKHGRTATYSIENLSADEEEALREHLAYIRWRRRK
ncbi:MAG: helix-turn-helix transcriptional regulator [Gammaproteobacteria bacterium]|nr:helix-turn-helix transcriptional regulator [Gammaproteobacteria bacterium]MYF51057.1 helix-turn-helix transcriptional regulator [Gammaproteobacteria bacterium]MYH16552.1 helix-turn-helix transcriptional regulator [Gammaproteobacteria bacterium]MYK81888.1 helix-turn-helix transcriptional regulator [Gammaproteobacteria bacterium]